MDDQGLPESPGDRAYQRRFTKKTGDKRDDYALDLFREIEAYLADIPRVDRLLLELGRFYNPLTDGPIVPLASRQRVVTLLREGNPTEARAVLTGLLARYAGAEEGGPATSREI